jgi:hypothetical protein
MLGMSLALPQYIFLVCSSLFYIIYLIFYKFKRYPTACRAANDMFDLAGRSGLRLFEEFFPLSPNSLTRREGAPYPFNAVRYPQLLNFMSSNSYLKNPALFIREGQVRIHLAVIASDGQSLRCSYEYNQTLDMLVGLVKRYTHREGLHACNTDTERLDFIRTSLFAKDVVSFVLMNLGCGGAVPFCNLFLDKKADGPEIAKRLFWVQKQARTCKACILSWAGKFPCEYPGDHICRVSTCKCDFKPFCLCPCDSCASNKVECEYILPFCSICDGEATQASFLTSLCRAHEASFSSTLSAEPPPIQYPPPLFGLYDISHLLKTLRNPFVNHVLTFLNALISSLMLFCLNHPKILDEVVLNDDKMNEG